MDLHLETCRALNCARIRYLVVGVFGINFYAKEVGQVMTTLDCDILLPLDAPSLLKAMRILRRLKFDLEAGGEPLIGEDLDIARGIVRAGACVRAVRKTTRIDLPLSIAGDGFEELWKRRRRFTVGRIGVNVAALRDLVRSKELAGRPKDRLFLETFRSTLQEILRRETRK